MGALYMKPPGHDSLRQRDLQGISLGKKPIMSLTPRKERRSSWKFGGSVSSDRSGSNMVVRKHGNRHSHFTRACVGDSYRGALHRGRIEIDSAQRWYMIFPSVFGGAD